MDRFLYYYSPGWSPPVYLTLLTVTILIIVWGIVRGKRTQELEDAGKRGCIINKWFCLLYTWTFGIYLAYILSITLIGRESFIGKHLELQVFWSYREILGGDVYYVEENLLNVLMMMPFGIFVPLTRRKRCLLLTAVLGIGASVIIEVLQYITARGLCEIDDVFHNAVGVLIGGVLYCAVQRYKSGRQN